MPSTLYWLLLNIKVNEIIYLYKRKYIHPPAHLFIQNIMCFPLFAVNFFFYFAVNSQEAFLYEKWINKVVQACTVRQNNDEAYSDQTGVDTNLHHRPREDVFIQYRQTATVTTEGDYKCSVTFVTFD